MIIKAFELEKKLQKNKIYLFYGKNQGQKEEIIKKKFLKDFKENVFRYSEKELFNNLDNFYNNMRSQSFFDKEKLIIINEVTDKIINQIEKVLTINIDGTTLILLGDSLEKKSKLRIFFETNKNLYCTPFFADNFQALSIIAKTFFRTKGIPISQEIINLIVNRANQDRKNLANELNKIENFTYGKKKININDILKLTNLAGNHSISDLVDFCLAKNQKKTSNILNENNYSNEDAIIIVRTFLLKAKRLLKLTTELKKVGNVDNVISSFKPPIFWKDKDMIKIQIKKWDIETSKKLISDINQIELLIKKNSQNSLNILADFILKNTVISN